MISSHWHRVYQCLCERMGEWCGLSMRFMYTAWRWTRVNRLLESTGMFPRIFCISRHVAFSKLGSTFQARSGQAPVNTNYAVNFFLRL